MQAGIEEMQVCEPAKCNGGTLFVSTYEFCQGIAFGSTCQIQGQSLLDIPMSIETDLNGIRPCMHKTLNSFDGNCGVLSTGYVQMQSHLTSWNMYCIQIAINQKSNHINGCNG